MDFIQVVILALIQGVTEFLPISSSAHLLLPKEVLGWPDQGLAFDVAVHVGTLTAVCLYFHRDIRGLLEGWFAQVLQGKPNSRGRLAWFIILATIPAALAGLLFNDYIELYLRSMLVIALTTIGFGLLLAWADMKSRQGLSLAEMTLGLAIVIGVAQSMALVPGTSRSGITITAALLLGFKREDAAKFSFLLSIPIIALSGGYKGLELLSAQDVNWRDIVAGVVIAGISAYLCIHFFLKIIARLSMLPFVIYRLLLGVVLLGLFFSGYSLVY